MTTRLVAVSALGIALALGACSSGEPETTKSRAEAAPAMTKPIPPDAVPLDNLMVNEPLTATPGDAQRGAQVMASRKLGNCLACHKVPALADEPFQGEIGPNLAGAGTRWQDGQLRALVVNAKTYFPQTVMPAYYRTSGLTRVRDDVAGHPILTAQQVEDVVAFLKTMK